MKNWKEAAYAGVFGLACVGMAGALVVQSDPFGDRYFNSSFVNWESPHVHPLDKSPDGTRLLAVNTADNRLEVFDISHGLPYSLGSVSVGLDPISVRARTNTEAWVVNRISDTVSVVDLTTMNVIRTMATKDEPSDIVFAGSPQRAFVTCSVAKVVQVFGVTGGDAPLAEIPIQGESPRAMAVSPDGSTVYAAVFESGNGTTVLGGGATAGIGGAVLSFPPNVVNIFAGPYGGVNPPPNVGTMFVPAKNPAAGTPPPVALIVRDDGTGNWFDDNNGDWTDLVTGAGASKSGRPTGWKLLDNDLASIDANSLSVSYARRLMNLCMSVGVNPVTGEIAVVGTEATNHIRYEPNLKGKFIRVEMATVQPGTLASTVVDLNPHLTYTTSSIPLAERQKSLGDPRAIVWNSAGTTAYVAGMGSNNVIVINQAGARVGLQQTIEVGDGPTGLALDEARDRLYVMNKFSGSISVVSLASEQEILRVPFFDPTTADIKAGRKHLYDTHRNSGLGQISCASCHIDATMDRLAWDLGDPSGTVDPLTGLNLGFGLPGLTSGFAPFHPMKGPMMTQTLQDIIGHEPHHWRGDRAGIEAFANAFLALQGGDGPLGAGEMQEFENFLATITIPPNPFRNLDNTLPTNLPLPGHFTTGRFGAAGQPLPNGNASNGLSIYRSNARKLDAGALSCVNCHTVPTGMGTDSTFSGLNYVAISPGPNGERHHAVVSVDGSTNITMKIPQLRNQYKKTGFNATQMENTAGFGLLHDGSVDSIERFVAEPVFNVQSDQEIANLTALILAFSGSEMAVSGSNNPFDPPGPLSRDTHAAVGKQTTLVSFATATESQLSLLSQFEALASVGKVGLVVKGRVNGVSRGWAYQGGMFQPDKAGPLVTLASVKNLASLGNEQTWMIVPKGSEVRIGIDRDLDGILDGDERAPCPGDLNADGFVDDADFQIFVVNYDQLVVPPASMAADLNRDALVDDADFVAFLAGYNQLLCP
ncbi:MAG: beta-propeller fold lactonase family protein [Phycisphaeraceae bacterium]|nr:beta-propeller fold lactonase family protein [Phycisphaeraceae bacterium]